MDSSSWRCRAASGSDVFLGKPGRGFLQVAGEVCQIALTPFVAVRGSRISWVNLEIGGVGFIWSPSRPAESRVGIFQAWLNESWGASVRYSGNSGVDLHGNPK